MLRPSSQPEIATARKLLYWLLLVILLFCVGEGLACAYRRIASREAVGFGYPRGLYVAHEILEYGLKPGFRGFFTARGYSAVPLEINADGYRDGPFLPRRDGVRRVAFLGDSVTFGSGVRADLRFSDLLEEKLRANDIPIESLNLAVNSYTFFHYLNQVRHDIPGIDPDLVAIGFCLNDIAPKETSGPRGLVRQAASQRPDFFNRLRDSSAMVSLVAQLVSAALSERRPPPNTEVLWQRWMERVMKLWESPQRVKELESDMAMLREELRNQGRDLLVLVLPERHDLMDPERYGRPRERLESLLDSLLIEYLDFREPFSGQPLEELFLSGDAVHLNPRGHSLVADTLAGHLERPSPR